jgi:hypothetical protein
VSGIIDDKFVLLFTSGVRHHDGNSQACSGQSRECAAVFAAGECRPSGAAGSGVADSGAADSARGGGRSRARAQAQVRMYVSR